MNYPKVSKILETKQETTDIKTILFRFEGKIEPGQFFMIWIPNVDEIPMSVSFLESEIKGITFKRIGDATNKLFNLKEGEKIGIRGPFGNGFKIKGKNILYVGGGTGISTITPSIEDVINKNLSPTVILGAKNKNELFFEKRIKRTGADIKVATDDGSKGYKGFVTDLVSEIIKNKYFDQILTCGPEPMMKKLFDITDNIPFQASLERFIKCGIGICGSCCIGEGLRVCKEGPVFKKEKLKYIKEFGVFKKDASGQKIKF
jgi:dihydroorotate dehydrogenase electron transfer subunit